MWCRSPARARKRMTLTAPVGLDAHVDQAADAVRRSQLLHQLKQRLRLRAARHAACASRAPCVRPRPACGRRIGTAGRYPSSDRPLFEPKLSRLTTTNTHHDGDFSRRVREDDTHTARAPKQFRQGHRRSLCLWSRPAPQPPIRDFSSSRFDRLEGTHGRQSHRRKHRAGAHHSAQVLNRWETGAGCGARRFACTAWDGGC